MRSLILILISLLTCEYSFSQIMMVPSAEKCKPHSVSKVYCLNPGGEPEFKGGDSAFRAYLINNYTVDKNIRACAKGNVVKLQFDVDTNGAICYVGLVNETNISDLVKQESIRLICNMPDWIPGYKLYADSSKENVCIRKYVDLHFPDNDSVIYPGLMMWGRSPLTVLPEKSLTDVYSYADVAPRFIADTNGVETFLTKSIIYPEKEKKARVEGVVYVKFVVEKDGSVTHAFVKYGVDGAPELSVEALRVISIMPKWSPALINGKPVRMFVEQPVYFSLQ